MQVKPPSHVVSSAGQVTRKLAGWVTGLRYETLSADEVAQAKKLLLDSLGCLLVGARNDLPRKAAAAVRMYAPPGGDCTLLVDGSRASNRDAAFVNGILLYEVGLNGYYKPGGTHPGVTTVPVLLALAESERDLTGRGFLTAMIAGYEVNGRIGRSLAPGLLERGFSPNGTVGTFGATAAAGSLLGLSEAALLNAFGINGSQAAGLQEWHEDASSTGIYHAGRAAQNAIEATSLARAGVTGPATIIEGKEGFAKAHSSTMDLEALVHDLGKITVLPQITIRPHYGATSTIAASTAAAEIVRRAGQGAGEKIVEVLVYCAPFDAVTHDFVDVQTVQAGRQSLQFNVALALAYGNGVTRDLNMGDVHHPLIRRLLPLTKLVAREGLARFESEVEVRFADGTSDFERCTTPLGDPRNPMDWGRTVEKFRSILSDRPGGYAPAFDAVIDAVSRLDHLTALQLTAAINSAAAVSRSEAG